VGQKLHHAASGDSEVSVKRFEGDLA